MYACTIICAQVKLVLLSLMRAMQRDAPNENGALPSSQPVRPDAIKRGQHRPAAPQHEFNGHTGASEGFLNHLQWLEADSIKDVFEKKSLLGRVTCMVSPKICQK